MPSSLECDAHANYIQWLFSQNMVMIGKEVSVPKFRYINIKKDSNNSIKMEWKRYNYFLMSFLCFFGFLMAVIFVIGAFIITAILVGILATFNLFENYTQIIGNLTFGVLLLCVIIMMVSGVRNLFTLFAPIHWLSISKDKITAEDLEISIDEVLRIEYSFEEGDEGLPKFFNLYEISIVDKSEETVFTMIASNHDGALLIEYLKNILHVEIIRVESENANQAESENANQENEMKKIRKAEYHDWDSKSFGTWVGDYFAKFIPRSILAITTVIIIFTLFGNGIENWN